ncbi:helix-turn-helix domain-containing protein [Sphingomonas sp. PP-CE-1G-424]|uniref:winged helix-turn-helix transcriptional regulator n=1 Tax=Sphingomonas sp. PP-CE-1G-424 TaxID=2135658 RepID=UPI0010562B65|nr:helix-turn-helix domain-containing protein [Sphingomonas sp. PP-CE-1G-424]
MTTASSTRLADRMERGDVFAPQCPSRAILRHVTSSWGTLALIALLPGTLRFSDLRRKVAGVSERMLSQTLKQLEGDGLVRRQSFPVVPPRVDYALTEQGRQAALLVQALADWIEDTLPELIGGQSRIE